MELVQCCGQAREYPWHFHARHWAFGQVCSGSVIITTLQGVYPLYSGQTFIIAPFAPHRLCIRERSLVAVLCSEVPQMHDSGLSRHPVFSRSAGSPVQGIFAKFSVADAGPDVRVQPMKIEESSPVGTVCRLLKESPDAGFVLESLAMLAGYSPWHFLRLFKRETGLTPHAFHLIHRLSMARAMLRSGTTAAEAAEAAVASGFTDQSHLHKFFKLHHGLTPRQFLKACVIL